MALRCGLVGDVEVFDRFQVYLQVDLGHQFGDRRPVCWIFRAVDPTGVARHGSIPGVLSYAIMADALSARDDRGQTLTARSPVAGSQDRSLIFVYFKIRLRA